MLRRALQAEQPSVARFSVLDRHTYVGKSWLEPPQAVPEGLACLRLTRTDADPPPVRLRRLHFLLGKKGLKMNQKRFRRLYREEGLAVRKRGGRKRTLGKRAPLTRPSRPNER